MRARNQRRVDLMIPIVKGWSTEIGNENAALGVQVHGGMGYIEATGAAQLLRDIRITTIYEGTTGIQAMDLIIRKIIRDQGLALSELIEDVKASADAIGDDLGHCVDWALMRAMLLEAAGILQQSSGNPPEE